MFDYEYEKDGKNTMQIRFEAVDHYDNVLDEISALLAAIMNGEYENDLAKKTAELLMFRLVNEAYGCGVDVGFTYSAPEYESWLKIKDDVA